VAFVAAAHPHTGRADPSAPQVNPIHLQREDAQRLRDQQRALDGDAPAVPAPVAPVAPATPVGEARKPPPVPEVHDGRTRRATGIVLVGVGALSTLISIPFLVANSPDDSSDPAIKNLNDSYDTTGKVFLVIGLVAGITGITLIATSKSSVQLVPVATPSSAGLAIMGRM